MIAGSVVDAWTGSDAVHVDFHCQSAENYLDRVKRTLHLVLPCLDALRLALRMVLARAYQSVLGRSIVLLELLHASEWERTFVYGENLPNRLPTIQ